MTPALQTTLLVSLFGSLILALFGIVGFAAKRWVDRVDGLHGAMDSLRTTIVELSSKFVTQAQHDKDIEALRSLGRRASDQCASPTCPFHEGHGV